MKDIELNQYEIAIGKKYNIKINGKVRYFIDNSTFLVFDDYFIRKPHDWKKRTN